MNLTIFVIAYLAILVRGTMPSFTKYETYPPMINVGIGLIKNWHKIGRDGGQLLGNYAVTCLRMVGKNIHQVQYASSRCLRNPKILNVSKMHLCSHPSN
jgi:hypothetical protein